MEFEPMLKQLAAAALFGAAGIVLFVVAYKVLKLTVPFSIEKELAEDQNVALGIVMGAMMLGVAIIVAAAIH